MDEVFSNWNKSITALKDLFISDKQENNIVEAILTVLDEKHNLAHAMIAQGSERKQIGMETLEAITQVVNILKKYNSGADNIIPDENLQPLMEDFKMAYENYCTDLKPEIVIRKMLLEEILIKTKVIEVNCVAQRNK